MRFKLEIEITMNENTTIEINKSRVMPILSDDTALEIATLTS